MIEQVINELSEQGVFKNTEIITLEMRKQYAITYSKLTKGNWDALSISNQKYALKLAGLNLNKVLKSNKSGFVYCISNPSFPKHIKVGITKDIDKRLASYQTYDPYRAFKIETYRFVCDKRLVEKDILREYKADLDKGEWVSDKSVIQYIKSLY